MNKRDKTKKDSRVENKELRVQLKETEQKHDEEFVTAECLVHSVMDQSTDAIVLCDIHGLIIRTSKTAHAICNRDALLQPFETIFPIRLRDEGQANTNFHVADVLRGKIFRGIEVSLNYSSAVHQDDNKIFNLLLSASLVRNPQDAVAGCIITLTDITESKRIKRRKNVLYATTQVLAESATCKEVIPKILQSICESLEWDLGVFWTIDIKTNELRCAEVWHKPSLKVPEFEALTRHTTFSPGVGLPGSVYANRKPLWITSVASDTNFPRASVAAKEGLQGAFGFPILIGNTILGIIEFFSHAIQPPDEDLLKMMASIGGQIGQFIKRREAEEALLQAHTELEQQLKERTAALVQANEALKMEVIEHKVADEALRESEDRLKKLTERVRLISWEADAKTWEFTYIGPQAVEILGYQLKDWHIANFWVEHIHPEDREWAVCFCKEQAEHSENYEFEYRMLSSDGRIVWLYDIVNVVRDEDGPKTLRGFMIDVTERKRLEEERKALNESLEKRIEERTRALVKTNEELQVKIVERNQAENELRRRIEFEKTIAGISTRFVVLSDFSNAVFKSLADAGRLSEAGRAYLFQFRDNGTIMDNTHEWCGEGVTPEMQHLQNLPFAMFPWLMENLHGGSTIHIPDVSKMPPEAAAEKKEFERAGIKAILILPVYAEKDLVGFIGFDNVVTVGTWHEEDITLLHITAEIIGNAIARKQSEARITYMAYHDTLTDLPNRNLFQDRLQVSLAHAKRSEKMVAVMILDLDHFKTINDTLGHQIGDLLLKKVAGRLRRCVREGDTVARTGGDEFTIVLPDLVHALNTIIVATKIIDALNQPFKLEGHEIHTTTSIGISLYPLDADAAEDLIKKADIAMYLSKARGKNTYRFYKPDMNTMYQ